jgi:hypothetical protein
MSVANIPDYWFRVATRRSTISRHFTGLPSWDPLSRLVLFPFILGFRMLAIMKSLRVPAIARGSERVKPQETREVFWANQESYESSRDRRSAGMH